MNINGPFLYLGCTLDTQCTDVAWPLCNRGFCLPDQSNVHIDSFSPANAPLGSVIAVSGKNFGLISTTSFVRLNGSAVNAILWWNDTNIVFLLPPFVQRGYVQIAVDRYGSNVLTLPLVTPTQGKFNWIVCCATSLFITNPHGLLLAPSAYTCASYGDGHVSTFYGVQYDFQSIGNYTLAQIGDLKVQVRHNSSSTVALANTAVCRLVRWWRK